MSSASWARAMDRHEPKTIEEAKQRLKAVRAAADEVIFIMTVEQAIRAQRVVREAGKRR